MDDTVFAKVHSFFESYPQRSYPKGKIIIFAGENPEKIFYLLSGRVVKYDTSYKGDEIIVNDYVPPAFFPVSYTLNKTYNPFFYQTTIASSFHIAPHEDVMTFLHANPDVAIDLLSRVYRGLDGILGRLVHIMSGSAKDRITYELLLESRRYGTPLEDGSYQLSLREKDIAARTGLSRETVSRELAVLKQQDVARSERRTIRILDITKLETILRKSI